MFVSPFTAPARADNRFVFPSLPPPTTLDDISFLTQYHVTLIRRVLEQPPCNNNSKNFTTKVYRIIESEGEWRGRNRN